MKPVGAGHVDRSRADADRGGPGVAQERGRAWRETQAAAGSPSDGRSRPAPSLWPGRQPTDVRADPGPGLRPQPASTVAGSEQQLLRGWRSVMLAPVGDGQRRRPGSGRPGGIVIDGYDLTFPVLRIALFAAVATAALPYLARG